MKNIGDAESLIKPFINFEWDIHAAKDHKSNKNHRGAHKTPGFLLMGIPVYPKTR